MYNFLVHSNEIACRKRWCLGLDPSIMFGLMNINLASPYKKITLKVPYSFGNILKVIFMSQTSSTLFHVNLTLHPLHLVIQQLSHMKFNYLPLERRSVLIYWMMKTLQSHTSLIKTQIHRLFINLHNSIREICGS